MESPVRLYVYDLSQGMAAMLSRQLTGRYIEGIWHTSVVVYGTEYYFGQGIMQSRPGSTHHGAPMKDIDMGTTQIPKDVFLQYLDSMRETWTADRYHLLDNNCNHFSNELCGFLVGKEIPSHITSLPADFLGTPFGQQILPMLENMFGPSQIARSATAGANAASRAAASNSLSPGLASMVGNIAAAAQSAPLSQTALQTATNLLQLESILASHRCVAVDFTSESCPPCRVISPVFEELIAERNSGYRQTGIGEAARSDMNKIVGVKVEVGRARDIATKYQITATPTFIFFLDGKKFSQFSGANQSELKSQIDVLLFTAFPPHPHTKLRLTTLDTVPSTPIRYTQCTQVDTMFTKLQTFLQSLHPPEHVTQSIQTIQTALKRKHEGSSTGPLNLPKDHNLALEWLVEHLDGDKIFPVLDILRLLVLDDTLRESYVAKGEGWTVMGLLYTYAKTSEPVSKAVRLMLLRLACNLFPASSPYLLSLTLTHRTSTTSTPHRTITTALLIESLLHPDTSVRQGAAALAFNIAVEEATQRRKNGGVGGAQEDEGLHEEWVSEIVAGVVKCLEGEDGDEIGEFFPFLRLLTSF
ncbi:PPPDE putative peptidase domain-containing protein [Fimicolochytrium jonesii]|uniref:PPPDE putative peptidase domain-containing protein n=1 Tax=Fimicolochytrium jonesii TaxID=1396493 RepID=UPI0022FDD44D|nr:PPPDE putative peptidase domain-containing protein [Fimicolochytrium jonesii]KAI8815816.1 PPPDE putative peptidase domain-containing protein [Fimicolochytrium jonesii]